MSDTFPHQARAGHPDDVGAAPPALHVAATSDAQAQTGRDARVQAVLRRGDIRDQAAERRDRAAEKRGTGPDAVAWVDRDWSGRDRDAAAADRADLIDALNHYDRADQTPPPATERSR